ncbi:MAG: phospho-N-acetylmuramoyl-pentapeptide-transferase [Dehalococcoidia bacterium]|nr:phospho-N-acetylmuramoyl-pentapeptide-transferase [Dehalococcoidia bacterium]
MINSTINGMSYGLVLGCVTFLIALAIGRPTIDLLRSHGIAKGMKADMLSSHDVKVGTPTIGGIIIFIPVFLVTLTLNLVDRFSMILPMFTIVGAGVLGAVDDMMNLASNNGQGMQARFKMTGLLAISLVAAISLYYLLRLESVYIPFLGKFSLGAWYMLVAALAVVGTANAVNLTDGLDTLAGGTAALAFASYGIIAFLQDQFFLVSFCYTVVGAILGFLWYNAHPAQVMMGDSGALALGATLAVVALMTGHWFLLPVIGFVFVIEAGSVILQVTYFKLTGGKRIFLMSPLHHHFEMLGWTETQVTTRFWLVGIMASMMGISLALA